MLLIRFHSSNLRRHLKNEVESKHEDVQHLKTKRKEIEKELKSLKAEGKIGKNELWWTNELASKSIRSEVFHGGAWAGDACRKFLGVIARKKKGKGDYKLFLPALKARIRETPECEIDSRVSKQDLLEFVDKIEQLCSKLAAAHRFYSQIVPFAPDELERGIAACKDYVAFYRTHFVGLSCTVQVLLKTETKRHVRPKHHNLETHIPIFARHWNVVGLFSEDIVETVHRQVNVLESTVTNLKNQKLTLLRLIDDRFNLYFERACQQKAGVWRKRLKHEKCKTLSFKRPRVRAYVKGKFNVFYKRAAKR